MNQWEVQENLNKIYFEFSHRHKNFEDQILKNYRRVEKFIEKKDELNKDIKFLIGAYFSNEYSLEAAALFNPSIVPHPDQSGTKNDSVRFVLSLRATGEGHISSIEFTEGEVDSEGDIELKTRSGLSSPSDTFFEDGNSPSKTLQNTDYYCRFPDTSLIDERVLFPFSKNEKMGMEDARFVKFEDGNYYATYTAYNGREINSKILITKDFINFEVRKLSGNGVRDKGMALFPRKIDGKYFMTSRQDGENLFLMKSENLFQWDDPVKIVLPRKPWEFVQLGNCGSPIETEHGWLLIIHAVGALRKYVISALLLDRDDPSKVIGFLNEPLIEPDESEREGYVPNVVYSCGSLIHRNYLIIPYAMSDSSCGFAKVKIDELIQQLTK